jgi:hypothetical protein
MSWLSNKTGRPKEAGGHSRIDISVDSYTREVLARVDNKSNFIEHCIDAYTQPKWIDYHNPRVTVSGKNRRFVDGGVFELDPQFSPGNAILRVNCFFDYCCEGTDIQFRVTVNGQKGLKLIEHSGGRSYTCSRVYNEEELGFQPMEGMFRGKDNYVFKFQFRSTEPGFLVQVKDVYFHIQIVDNPLLNHVDRLLDFYRRM